jgi:hypothetical protein
MFRVWHSRYRRATRSIEAILQDFSPAMSAWHFGPTIQAAGALLLIWALDRAFRHRPRHSTAPRLDYPAFTLARTAVQLVGHLCGPAHCSRWGHGRLPDAVVGVLAIQVGHWQGRDGLRRLQTARRPRRLAGLADAAGDHPAFVRGRRRGRISA